MGLGVVMGGEGIIAVPQWAHKACIPDGLSISHEFIATFDGGARARGVFGLGLEIPEQPGGSVDPVAFAPVRMSCQRGFRITALPA